LGVNNTRKKKIWRLIPEVPSCTTLPICLSHDEIDTADDCHNVGEHVPLDQCGEDLDIEERGGTKLDPKPTSPLGPSTGT